MKRLLPFFLVIIISCTFCERTTQISSLTTKTDTSKFALYSYFFNNIELNVSRLDSCKCSSINDTLVVEIFKHDFSGGEGVQIKIKDNYVNGFTLHSGDYKHYSLDSINGLSYIKIPFESCYLKKEIINDSIKGTILAYSKVYFDCNNRIKDKFVGKFRCKIKN